MFLKEEYKCLIISDFNAANLTAYLNNDKLLPKINVSSSPFDKVIPILINGKDKCWNEGNDIAFVWTHPEKVIESFNKVLDFKEVDIRQIYDEVDNYASLLAGISNRVRYVFVATWSFLFSNNRGMNICGMRYGKGVINILLQMNLRLSERLKDISNVYLLDSQRWICITGRNAFDSKLWYMAKIPYCNEVFRETVIDIKSALISVTGSSKKIIILDLDNTLWGGAVGDVGVENIILGGHEAIGEAYVDFQRTLKAFTNRGILLGIVSKNEESIAIEAIKSHPEMILDLDDFAGWKINWNDKARNIVDLVNELELGLHSAVFIDDSPLERARVREALPEISVPEWPQDKMLYKSALMDLYYFGNFFITDEDRMRTQMYKTENMRQKAKLSAVSLDEWLKSLGISISVSVWPEAEKDIQRITQLLNKTNQMNLRTRRMSDKEFKDWANKEEHKVWIFRVKDKFGDLGLTGIISMEIKNKIAEIIDFVLSCRAFGRGVEEAMLYVLCSNAKDIGLKSIRAEYLATPKNKPCLEFWEKSIFQHDGSREFFWNLEKNYPKPDTISELSME